MLNQYLCVCFKALCIHLREREREREREGATGGGAEGERESQADSLLSAEPDAGLDPTTLRS